jgi:LacI family transcriptional regulator
VGEGDDRRRTAGDRRICTNQSVEGLPLGTIGIDSSAGMVQAVAHLHQLGHRRIGYLAGPESSWSNQRRLEGLDRAAASCGVEVHRTVAGSTSDAGYAALPELLHRGVTAVVAFNDLVTVGALARLRELDVDVPQDLSVVGFDDIPVAAFLGPPLTTVNVPKEELGRQAWAMLRGQMQDGAIAPEQWLPCSLVVRRSTAPPVG